MMRKYDLIAATKALAISAAGYVVMLGVGLFAARLLDDGESFTGLGIIALTVVFAAPLGAVAGAYLGLRQHGAHTMLRPSRYLLTAGVIGLVAVMIGGAGAGAIAGTFLVLAASLVVMTGFNGARIPSGVSPTQP